MNFATTKKNESARQSSTAKKVKTEPQLQLFCTVSLNFTIADTRFLLSWSVFSVFAYESVCVLIASHQLSARMLM